MSELNSQNKLEELVKFCYAKGFVYPGSEIYGGLANTWDYGPLGVELKNNIKQAWWRYFVHGRDDIVGQDAAILMNKKVWEASGHVSSFSDPLVDSKSSKKRFRADKLIEEFGEKRPNNWAGEKTPPEDLFNFLMEEKVPDPETGETGCWTMPRQFNLMFKTHQGVTEDSGAEVYMRPETAQGIFVNFKNVQRTTRKKLPFGIAQIGKAFRNEITPGNFTFRTREFEQMEIEYFFDPEKTKWEELFAKLKEDSYKFITEVLEIDKENLRLRDHEPDELSHYSKGTTDIEYKFPFGWGELCAAGAYRTGYDLTQHQTHSGENLGYREENSKETIVPHVIEPSFGMDRAVLTVMIDCFKEQVVENDETRRLMQFPFHLAPYKIAVLPLMKKDGLKELAEGIYQDLLKQGISCDYDEAGSIGKRYRRQDENGTPWCITIDYESKDNQTVTLRHRDTMEQSRIKIEEISSYLNSDKFKVFTN
jgi:glycyl-tRNA synthetase